MPMTMRVPFVFRMPARCAALGLILLAGACACASAPPARAPAEPAAMRAVARPLASYANDPFVPVNLYLNANEQVRGDAAAMIEYAAAQLRDSGAFVRVDRGVERWPVTIQGRYGLEETPPGFGRQAISVLSLGLARAPLDQKHTLVAEIFEEPDQVAMVELSVQVHEAVPPFSAAARQRAERAAVDALLERMMGEIAQRKVIPRWSAFKPEPKKKPRPVERPT